MAAQHRLSVEMMRSIYTILYSIQAPGCGMTGIIPAKTAVCVSVSI